MKISYTYILFSLFLALLPGCELIHDDLPETRADGEPVYIRLQISTGGEMSATRSNPTGGEDGDGREPGTDNENAVSNVTLFLYDASVSINDANAATTPIDKVITFNQLEVSGKDLPTIEKKYTSETKEVSGLSAESYNVLAIANCDLSSETFSTLGDVLDYAMTGALWSGSGDATTSFVMSSEKEATIPNVLNSPDIQTSTEQYPAEVEITIERLAARVDYIAPGSNGTANEYITNRGDKAVIKGAALCNQVTKGMWMFKRIGDDPDATDVEYLGNEEPDAGGIATNWVIDYLEDGKTYVESPSAYDNCFDVTVDNQIWHCIGYTGENVQQITDVTDFDSKKVTGVVFQVQYTPKNFPEGETFYEYRGSFYQEKDEVPENYVEADLNTYENGICYYTWWIKHSNDNANTYGIMEYATVRNNLYQLTVNSISSLNDIQIIVAVKNWDRLKDDTINW